jgi:hypothetical protein
MVHSVCASNKIFGYFEECYLTAAYLNVLASVIFCFAVFVA